MWFSEPSLAAFGSTVKFLQIHNYSFFASSINEVLILRDFFWSRARKAIMSNGPLARGWPASRHGNEFRWDISGELQALTDISQLARDPKQAEINFLKKRSTFPHMVFYKFH